MRLLQRPQRDRHVVIEVAAAFETERLRYQAGPDAVVGLEKNVTRIVVHDIVKFQLIGRHAAADADIEAAVAQMIEHADFLDQPQRRIERQQVDQRAEPQLLGLAGDGAKIDARHRNQIQRRGVVLGDMQAIKAGFVGGGGEFNPLIEKLRDRPCAILNVIEKSDFHAIPPSPSARKKGRNSLCLRRDLGVSALWPSSVRFLAFSAARSHPQRGRQSHARRSCFAPSGAPHVRVMSRESAIPAIEVERLVKIYKEVPAVDGISFSIPRGSITGLLGGNGAGKTTTIAMIMGLLMPTSGSVKVLGAQMPHQRYRVLQRMNFESPYVDMPMRLTIRQNLTVFGMLYGVRHLGERIAELAEALDLTRLLDRPTGKLSAGQKTRVSLAKSLINAPELLLLDEPTASLDPDTADWVAPTSNAIAGTGMPRCCSPRTTCTRSSACASGSSS